MRTLLYIVIALVLILPMTGCQAMEDLKANTRKAAEEASDNGAEKREAAKEEASGPKDCCKKTKELVSKMDKCCADNVGKKAEDMKGCCKGGMSEKSGDACCKKSAELMAKMPACCQKSLKTGQTEGCCQHTKYQ